MPYPVTVWVTADGSWYTYHRQMVCDSIPLWTIQKGSQKRRDEGEAEEKLVPDP